MDNVRDNYYKYLQCKWSEASKSILWSVNDKCNLRCHYCVRAKFEPKKEANNKKVFSEKLKKLAGMSLPEAARVLSFRAKITFPVGDYINISALKQTLNKTGDIFLINITGGGEPFLVTNILKACIEITKKHYIGFNTNLTPKVVEKFAERIDPERVLCIVASCHLKELERLNLTERYINNFLFCKNKGFSILADVVAYPPLMEEIGKYKEFFKEKGIDLCFSPFYGEYAGKSYPEAYAKEDLQIFDDLSKTRLAMYYSRGKICNAGYSACSADPQGDLYVCPCIREPLGNLYKRIQFKDQLISCPVEKCICPLVLIAHSYLLGRARYGVGAASLETILPLGTGKP